MDSLVLDYSGHDPRLKKPYCVGCQKGLTNALPLREPAHKPVRRCSACKLLYYCSRECQRSDWKLHKDFCKGIKALRANIHMFDQCFGNRPEAQNRVGHYWEYAEYYLKARFDLSFGIHKVAADFHVWDHWHDLLNEVQEVNRLGHVNNGYDYGAKYKFPLYLLHVGRLDDSYAISRYMMGRLSDEDEQDGAQDTLHVGSKPGDWIYPKEDACRFNDFLAECPPIDRAEFDPAEPRLYFLTAAWIIKKINLSILQCNELRFQCFFKTPVGQRLKARNSDIYLTIFEFMIGFEGFDTWQDYRPFLKRQERQLEGLFWLIHTVNPHIFSYMARIPLNYSSLPQNGDEAATTGWDIVNSSQYSLMAIPGLKEWGEKALRLASST